MLCDIWSDTVEAWETGCVRFSEALRKNKTKKTNRGDNVENSVRQYVKLSETVREIR